MTTGGGGITPIVPTSTGYCTLAEFKSFGRITSTDANDDSVIGQLIDSASRYIDTQTNRVWYQTTETHLLDVPSGDATLLMLDVDFASITAVVNGDGTTLSSATDYVTLPANGSPIWGIQLKDGTGTRWLASSGNPWQAISVTGLVGLAVPADIKEACLLIIKAAYNRRLGENQSSTSIITQGGIVITPEDVPAKALDIISNRRRVGFG